jgi:hypothetical protein
MLRKWCAPLVFACAVLLIGDRAEAQVVGVTGAAYHDNSATDLFLFRSFIRPAGTGLQPLGSLDAYLISYSGPVFNSGHMVGSLTPALGAAYVTEDAALSARAGYTLITTPNPRAGRNTLYVPLERSVTTGLDFYHQGMTPRIDGMAIYHWGPSMLLTESNVHVPVTRVLRSSLEAGLIGVWQSNFDDDLRTWLAGPSLRLVQNGVAVGVSAGVRGNGSDSDRQTFLRVGGTFAPFIRS